MSKKTSQSPRSAEDGFASAPFPETQSAILAEAADGKWDRFFDLYLAPCWREVLIACRIRRIPLDDARDLFQELTIRLMREGRLNRISVEDDPNDNPRVFRGNVSGKFLKYREVTLKSARFRTVLKSVIRNLILEHLRRRRRLPGNLVPNGFEPLVDESVSLSVDRQWLAECLLHAAQNLKAESEAAQTKGRRRLFDVMYRSTVQNEKHAEIAVELGIDRSTVSDLVIQARTRFVDLLREATEIEDIVELKGLVTGAPELLIEALTRVYDLGAQPTGRTGQQ